MANKIKITVVGSGYVGMSLAVLLAQHNDVIVLDVDADRVDKINNKQSTVADVEIEAYLVERELSLSATLDKHVAYGGASFVVVATPTNYDSDNNRFDTSSVDSVVKDALELTKPYFNVDNKSEADLLNMQWDENSKLNSALTNMIAMVDTSGSMECDNGLPLHSAIGLGIRIAEKSKLGKRVITFNAKPEWVDLEGLKFTEMVSKIRGSAWGMNTNFDAAFDMILQTAIANNISPYEMQNFVLLICSDMQIDQAQISNSGTMYDRMRNKYAEAGLRTKYQTPYTLPHIVFWNLRSTTGFPSLSTAENTSMLSGNSAVLLNNFSDKGPAVLKDLTPWKMLETQLSNVRYKYLENVVNDIWRNEIEYMLD